MPRFGPITRNELVYYLKRIGFEGPFSGGKHQFMVRETISITIPNPHGKDIGRELLSRILKQAVINKNDWESLN